MNFLSHYYLHSDKQDNYFTVGLTIPDVLGFHSRKIRLNKKFLKIIGNAETDYNLKSFIAGMYLHLEVDAWFHNSDFFKKNVNFLQINYIDFNNKKTKLPNFYSHIVLEILIDRYLLIHYPNIVDEFYDSYKMFDFREILKIFSEIDHFDEERFLSLSDNIAYSSFLREYTDNNSIFSILERVSNRIKLPMMISVNEDDFAKFINNSYVTLEKPIVIMFEKAKNELKYSKRDIIKKFENYKV